MNRGLVVNIWFDIPKVSDSIPATKNVFISIAIFDYIHMFSTKCTTVFASHFRGLNI